MPKKKTILDPIVCLVCEKTFVPKTNRVKTCSRSCGCKLGNTKEAREKGKQTRLERYGDPNYNNREKVRETIKEKYGEQYINTSQVPHIKAKIVESYTKNNGGMGMASKKVAGKVLDSTKKKLGIEDDSITNIGQIEEVKDKIRDTTTEKWGGIGFASEELAQKSKDTFKELYGEDLYSSSYMVKRRTEGFLEKYGVKRPLELKEFVDKMKKTSIERNGGAGGNNKSIQDKMNENIIKFESLYNEGIYSLIEIEEIIGLSKDTIRRYAKNLGIELPKGNRLNQSWKILLERETGIQFELEGGIYNSPYKKVDLYNEEFKIAVEINPTITHSSQPSVFHEKKVSKSYHQERAVEAEQNGWNLIQVFDWDREEDIISLIKSLSNKEQTIIHARKCETMEISIKEAKSFTKDNHRQGNVGKESLAFGLFYKGKLVQVMTFSKERFNKAGERDYEIIRMCSLKEHKVIGGASKLFSSFINSNHKPNRIKTFVDYSKGNGSVYRKMGMEYKGFASLNGYYSNIDTGESHKESTILKKFGSNYKKENKTRQQYMNSNRFYLIYDAGNKIFEWIRN